MRIYIIYTKAGPLEAYSDEREAYLEYERLRDMDDLVEYSLINLPVRELEPETVEQDYCDCPVRGFTAYHKQGCPCYDG